jgi:hypothetical protein
VRQEDRQKSFRKKHQKNERLDERSVREVKNSQRKRNSIQETRMKGTRGTFLQN